MFSKAFKRSRVGKKTRWTCPSRRGGDEQHPLLRDLALFLLELDPGARWEVRQTRAYLMARQRLSALLRPDLLVSRNALSAREVEMMGREHLPIDSISSGYRFEGLYDTNNNFKKNVGPWTESGIIEFLKISIQNSMTQPWLLKIDDRRKNSGIVRARHPRQVHPLVCPPLDDRAPPRISGPDSWPTSSLLLPSPSRTRSNSRHSSHCLDLFSPPSLLPVISSVESFMRQHVTSACR